MQKELDIIGVQNMENYVSPILKEMKGKRRLNRVTQSENNAIILEFDDEPSEFAKSFVKQFKKRDYNSLDDAIQMTMNRGLERHEIVGIVETQKVWLVFWSKS